MSFIAACSVRATEFDRACGSRRPRNAVPSRPMRHLMGMRQTAGAHQQQFLSALAKSEPAGISIPKPMRAGVASRPAKGADMIPPSAPSINMPLTRKLVQLVDLSPEEVTVLQGLQSKTQTGSSQPRNRHARAEIRCGFRDDRWNLDPLSHPPRRSAADPEHRPARRFRRFSGVLLRESALPNQRIDRRRCRVRFHLNC